MSKTYISGPMTGIEQNNFPAFNAAAATLRGKGIFVINPAEIDVPGSDAWEEFLKADIKALCECDTIALLPGWENSKGAHLELHIAHRVGMKVVFL